MRGGGREWVVVDRDPTSNESFETLETLETLQAIGCFVCLARTVNMITDIRWLCCLQDGVLSQVSVVHHMNADWRGQII